MRHAAKIIHIQFVRKIFFRYFYSNEVDKHSLLFSLPFSKVLEWYHKKIIRGKKMITWSRDLLRTWL